MTSTYQSLMSQIGTLQAKAEAARQKEVAGVVAQIRGMMSDYGISDEHIVGKTRAPRGRPARGTKSARAKAPNPPRFRNPETGQTWSGFGRAPAWIAGQDRAAFAA